MNLDEEKEKVVNREGHDRKINSIKIE